MANSTTFFYCCVTDDGETRHELKMQGSWDFADAWEAQTLAEQAADDYHSNHDGWESSWPLVFALYSTEEGPERARFSVEMEAVPRFSGRAVT